MAIAAGLTTVVYGIQLREVVPVVGMPEDVERSATSPDGKYVVSEMELGGVAYCIDYVAIRPANQPWDPLNNYEMRIGEPVLEASITDVRWVDNRTIEVFSRPETTWVSRSTRWQDVRILWHVDPKLATKP